MSAKGLKIGDGVLVMSDTGALASGLYKGTDGMMMSVEFDAAGAAVMGYKKAGEHWVSARRLRAKEGANAEEATT